MIGPPGLPAVQLVEQEEHVNVHEHARVGQAALELQDKWRGVMYRTVHVSKTFI